VLEARHPTSHHGLLADRPAHDLGVGLHVQPQGVLTDQRLGTILNPKLRTVEPH